jgi:hypothetical protein
MAIFHYNWNPDSTNGHHTLKSNYRRDSESFCPYRIGPGWYYTARRHYTVIYIVHEVCLMKATNCVNNIQGMDRDEVVRLKKIAERALQLNIKFPFEITVGPLPANKDTRNTENI